MKDKNEIIKALECCNNPPGKADCRTCPFYHSEGRCTENMLSNAIDLINRLQAENERKDKILNSYALQYGTVKDQSKRIEEIKSEARKEFAERLKGRLTVFNKRIDGRCLYEIGDEDIDNLLKELDGKDNSDGNNS